MERCGIIEDAEDTDKTSEQQVRFSILAWRGHGTRRCFAQELSPQRSIYAPRGKELRYLSCPAIHEAPE